MRLRIAVLLLLACSPRLLRAGPIPGRYIDSVVAIGRKELTPGPMQGKWIPEASGFLFGELLYKVDAVNNRYNVYLVTNRHVIEEHLAATSAALSVKFNSKAGPARVYDIPLSDNGKPTWHAHPNPLVDVAVVLLNGPFLQQEELKFSEIRSNVDVLSRAQAKATGLSEGQGIFVLGFPMGLVGEQQNYVIVRQGAIARIRDVLDSTSPIPFLIDAMVFPGSSGSPVFLKPEHFTLSEGPPPITQPYLIGIVRSYLPYTDVAYSVQTKHPRITFEENSGLGEVIPADYIEETIQDYMRTLPQPK